ncbi:MAG: pur operon repressor [Peptococcaceae bacterium]|jgi:purine operon repressor|nr:pur operon repressor [Peptococcaceae bacterium]MDH7526087.1 pur operon repressor [Peptococcaceae bacterium]
MEKWRRSERVAVMTKYLLERPNTLVSLNHFTSFFKAAKSSISEDISIMRDVFQKAGLGRIETQAGAGGGMIYYPHVGKKEASAFISDLVRRMADPGRILPGGFLYMTDIIFDARVAQKVGEIFAQRFLELEPQYVVTIETKGIPLALMTARALNRPLVIIRDAGRVTEGSAVSLNYVTGSSRQIRTMSLSRRALPVESRVIIIDDFMKAGGTARGMVDLLSEFKSTVLGIGVLVDTGVPEKKLVSDYYSLLKLVEVNEQEKKIVIIPN